MGVISDSEQLSCNNSESVTSSSQHSGLQFEERPCKANEIPTDTRNSGGDRESPCGIDDEPIVIDQVKSFGDRRGCDSGMVVEKCLVLS